MKKALVIILALIVCTNCWASTNDEISNIKQLQASKKVKDYSLTEEQLKEYVDKNIITIKEIYDTKNNFLCSLANSFAYDYDSDHDGISDGFEIFKYKLDPNNNDTDKDGIKDGEGHERQEKTYNFTVKVKLINAYELANMNNDYQDTVLIEKTNNYSILEITIYPYAKIPAYYFPTVKKYNKENNTRSTELCNYDSQMKQDILAKSNFSKNLSEKQYVKTIQDFANSNIEHRVSYEDIPSYLSFNNNSIQLLLGDRLNTIKNKKFASVAPEEIIMNNVLGKEMYYRKTTGECFSRAIYYSTMLRCFGIPTRICHCMPFYAYHEDDEKKLLDKLTDKNIRKYVEKVFSELKPGVVEHVYYQAYIGNKWINCDDNIINARFDFEGFIDIRITDNIEDLCRILAEDEYDFMYQGKQNGFDKHYPYELLDLYEYKSSN